MNSSAPILDNAEANAAELPIDRQRKSGYVIKPIDVEKAKAVLDSLYEDDEEEQRETFRVLKQAIDEGRRARGERLLFEDYE